MIAAVISKLVNIVHTCKLSGAGAGQRGKYDENNGCVDLSKCIDGGDGGNFIKNNEVNQSYLLYWWHTLDKEGFVQFTLCVLDQFQRASTPEFNLVSMFT